MYTPSPIAKILFFWLNQKKYQNTQNTGLRANTCGPFFKKDRNLMTRRFLKSYSVKADYETWLTMSTLILMSFESWYDKNLNPFHNTIIIIIHASTSLISRSCKSNGSLYFIWNNHCVNSVQIRSFSWSLFSCIQFKYRKIRTGKNSVFGHFSRSESWWFSAW